MGTASGDVYTSEDFGKTWKQQSGNGDVFAVASSADGKNLVAISYGNMFVSDNYGQAWEARGLRRNWETVAISADGKQIATGSLDDDYIYTSSPTSEFPVPSTTVGNTGALGGGQSVAIELRYHGNGKFVIIGSTGTFEVR